jgi:hypothetical protein
MSLFECVLIVNVWNYGCVWPKLPRKLCMDYGLMDLWIMDYLCTMEGCECVLWIVYFACESVYVNCDIVNCVFCCQLKGAQNSVLGGGYHEFSSAWLQADENTANYFRRPPPGPTKIRLLFSSATEADENSQPTNYFRRLWGSRRK